MTIDDAIRQLEELRRIHGGHVPVKYRRVWGPLDEPKTRDEDISFEMEKCGDPHAWFAPGRVLRIYTDRS